MANKINIKEIHILLMLFLLNIVGSTYVYALQNSYTINSRGTIRLLFPDNPTIIRGSFFQFGQTKFSWNDDQLRTDLDNMLEVQMDILIVQWTVMTNQDQKGTWCIYPSSKYWKHSDIVSDDPLETILAKADINGIKVFVGLVMISPYTPCPHPTWDAAMQKDVAGEVWNLYGNHRSFYGWYISGEYENHIWWEESDVINFLSTVAGYCHSISGGKPVMIAPYFSLNRLNPNILTPSQTQQFWTTVLASANIDIVATQDGIGCTRGITFDDIHDYYPAYQAACEANGLKHWADLEIFDAYTWNPAPISRILKQIEVDSQYCEKIVCYEFSGFMDPQMGFKQQKLFEDYRQHLFGE